MNSEKPALRQPWVLLAGAALIATFPLTANAEDIDIFVSGGGGGGAANVLVVIDNTASWADNAQHWPTEECDPVNMPGVMVQYQGQAELCGLIKLVPTLTDSVRLGVMLFNQNGTGNCCSGGYVRYAMQPMTAANKTDLLQNYLKPLVTNFSDPANKAADNASYSMGLFDAYKYFGGWASPDPNTWVPGGSPPNATHFGLDVFATPPSTFHLPDPLAYSASYTKYVPPSASAADGCGGKDYIIFIGNGFPNSDTPPTENMKTILEGVGGNSSQIPLPVLTTLTSTTTATWLSAACYTKNANGLKACTTAETATCPSTFDTCACGNPTSSTGCSGGKVEYTVTGTLVTTTVDPTSQTALPGANTVRYADEWTRFLYTTDVSSAAGQQKVTTFTIDTFNAKQNADQTALLWSMANAGGGQYYAARNRNDLQAALGDIFAKILADNSVFASASLPVNATNRAVSSNEVYYGMFRPDPDAKPLWNGNLKRYKIGNFTGAYDLADVSGKQAINPLTGFLDDCATSWWTTDSGKYWAGVSSNPPPFGKCPSSPTNSVEPYSDTPDGPIVEKGAVAEVIRKGNNPTGATTWALNRTLYTNGFVPFNTSNASSMAAADVDFVRGLNVDANGNYLHYQYDPSDSTKTTDIRPTVHGDVVHARPLAINYPSGQTVIYYGANDGWLRAADSATGKELWAYVAPEFFSTLPRLRQNSPLIAYSFVNQQSISPLPQPKNYYFDGSMGLYQNADSSNVWIFETMRRGGRMIYAFDVTTPTAPRVKWTAGCPHLSDDNNCTNPAFTAINGHPAIGQTWSTPTVALLKTNGVNPIPIVSVGGGYDNCEDGAPNNPCTGSTGSIVYILNAADGSVLASFTTTGRVVADVAYVDLDNDGIPDLAYAVDTRGNIYRISFGMSRTAPLTPSLWTSTLAAYTNGLNANCGAASTPCRKFLYAPAVMPTPDGTHVYLALGTGDREEPLSTQYPYSDPVRNRFYVYLDDVTATNAVELDDTTSLCDFTTSTSCTTLTQATDACGNPIVVPGSGKSGWFMDLPGRGEQTVTAAVIPAGFVAFSTNRAVPPSTNSCAPLGEARAYAVNLFSGSGLIGAQPNLCGGDRSEAFPPDTGLPPSPVVADVDVDGKVVKICIGCAGLGPAGPISGIGPQKVPDLPPQARKRIYWRQEGGS